MSAALVLLTGDDEGTRVPLAQESLAIGRHPRRDLVLREDVVSRHQATLRFEGDRYVLRDEESTNGTFVNNRKIKEQVLQDGDVIEFGLDGPAARFEWEDQGGATREIAVPTRQRRDEVAAVGSPGASEARGPAEPAAASPTEPEAASPAHAEAGERLICPDCSGPFRVEARELEAGPATFVFLDEARLPARCPHCDAALERSRLDEMLG